MAQYVVSYRLMLMAQEDKMVKKSHKIKCALTPGLKGTVLFSISANFVIFLAEKGQSETLQQVHHLQLCMHRL